MGTLIRVAFALKWSLPVYVGEDDLLDHVITGPGDALRYMSEHFLFKSGPQYWQAFSLCHAAVLGQSDPELARPLFIAACAADSVRHDEDVS